MKRCGEQISIPDLLRQAADRLEEGDARLKVVVEKLSQGAVYVGVIMRPLKRPAPRAVGLAT